MEVLLEIALASSLNLNVINWNTPFSALIYSNVLSSALFATCAGVLLFLVIIYAKNLEKINNQLLNERVGREIEGCNQKKTFERYLVVINLAFFLGHRIAFIASVIFLDKFLLV